MTLRKTLVLAGFILTSFAGQAQKSVQETPKGWHLLDSKKMAITELVLIRLTKPYLKENSLNNK